MSHEDRSTLEERIGSYPRVTLCGLDFLEITEADCVELIAGSASAGFGGWVVTPNLDVLRQCVHKPDVMQTVKRADVRVADGMPLVWASKLQKTPLPERVSGSSIVEPLANSCAKNGLGLFLLGGAPGVVEGAREALLKKNPNLDITGMYCPPFGFEKDEVEMARIREAVIKDRPDLILVALSFPKGERLIEQLRVDLPNAWWVGVGISFSFVSGDVKRAPKWMQKSGTEWLFRLSQEPRRLARRYLIDDLPFVFRLFTSALYHRFR